MKTSIIILICSVFFCVTQLLLSAMVIDVLRLIISDQRDAITELTDKLRVKPRIKSGCLGCSQNQRHQLTESGTVADVEA